MRHIPLAVSLLAATLLAACGGTSSSSGPTKTTTADRGTLLASPPNRIPIPQPDGTGKPTLEPAAFAASLEAGKPGITQVTGTPKCALSIYYMNYNTIGGANEATTASGAIFVPSGTDAACSGPRPVLLYAHGTTTDKKFNMSNVRENTEASLVAAFFAAQGYIVVAPNYTGYDTSPLPYHPYLNADAQAADMIDALRAARSAFASIGASDNGKLVIGGYSQGGHVAMATQRAMQLNFPSEFKVSALVGMSGPYAMALLGDVVFGGTPNAGGTVFLPLISTSWQKSYGGLYTSPNEIYEDKYATGIETLLPSATLGFNDLFTTGKLPQAALFAKDSLPGPSSPAFGAFFGDGNLIKTSFRNGYLADLQKNPCNVNPAAPLNCTPAHAFRKAGVKNDLRTYVPTPPTFLCGGNADPTVFFASTQATAGYFLANGKPAAALQTLDVDSAVTGATDPYAAAKVGFATSKTAVINAAIAAKADPATAVASQYHGTLVPPFCMAAARGFLGAALQ